MAKKISDALRGLKALEPASRQSLEPGAPAPFPPEATWHGLAIELGARVERTPLGEHLTVRQWFPEPSDEPPRLEALRLLAPGAPEDAADSERWLFLDTETTGVAGGTGTYAFLIGIAWWEAGGLEVEQFFMRDFHEEPSVLLALNERLSEHPVLVTFNGKSFDWPLLETRFRMARSLTPRVPLAHLDFLHPARQLWGLRLGSARLAALEEHILGRDRAEDVPSEMIPQIYFNFLRSGAWESLVPVFRHNQMDLRSLAALSQRALALVAAPERCSPDPLELYGVSRIHDRRGQRARARALYGRALDAGLPKEIGRMAHRQLARLAKRDRDYGLAAVLWEKLRLENERHGAESVEDLVELAMHYEHRARDPERAAALTKDALVVLRHSLDRGQITTGRYRSLRSRLDHRLGRLRKKKALPSIEPPAIPPF